MQAAGLIDTGALLALLDADDGWHVRQGRGDHLANAKRILDPLKLPVAFSY